MMKRNIWRSLARRLLLVAIITLVLKAAGFMRQRGEQKADESLLAAITE